MLLFGYIEIGEEESNKYYIHTDEQFNKVQH